MLKRILSVSILFLIVSLAQAQQDTTTYVHPSKIALMGEGILFNGKSFQSIGVNMQIGVGREFYLNYHFGFGSSSEGGLYIHSTLGAAGGAALVVNAIGEKGIGWLAFLLCLVPEGVGYSVPVNKKLEIVPYLNPLQCDYRDNPKTFGEEFIFSGDAGSRFCFKMPKKLFFEPHFGVKLLYNTGEWGVEGGASIGKYF